VNVGCVKQITNGATSFVSSEIVQENSKETGACPDKIVRNGERAAL